MTPSINLRLQLKDAELDPKYVMSCRVRTSRAIRGNRFPPKINRAERRNVEETLVKGLSTLKGKYSPLKTMPKEESDMLRDNHMLFQKPTGHFLVDSGAARDWPDGRGIWYAYACT